LSILVAGRNAPGRVVALAASQGWTLQRDYTNVGELAATARLAVAPMTSTAGIQIKVLEAAAAGLAQVASPEAVAGFEPGLPVAIAGTDREFAERISYLLAAAPARRAQADAARVAVAHTYTVPAWVDWARGLVG
jgi:spore maturation protein CgeB